MHILSREMLAPVGLPGFVSEYLRLYAFALAFALLVAVGFYIPRLPGWFRSMRAASWPMAQGTIEGVKVNVFSGQALGELAYSYVAEGERYSGYFLLQFANEQDAWRMVSPRKGQSILVRYETRNPAFSAVRSEDQNFLFGNKDGKLITRLLIRHVVEIMDLSAWKDLANRLGAGNWPVIKGRIEYGAVTQHRDTETWLRFPNLHGGGKLFLLCRRRILLRPHRKVICSRSLGAEICRQPQRQSCIRSLQPKLAGNVRSP